MASTQPSWAHRVRRLPHYPAVAPGWWRDVIGTITWLSVLAVLALWVNNRGLQVLTFSIEGFLNSLGRLCALLSANLLLIQVFLIARVPVIERSYGQDELIHRHRIIGFASINLMIVHIVVNTVGYAMLRQQSVSAQVVEFLTEHAAWRGMFLAFVGAGLLLLVGFTSMRLARARMRYETWHLLHLYAYLGVGLAVPHMLWTGRDFIASPVATVYWWSVYVIALAAVIIWRVAVPLWRSYRHQLRVHAVIPEGPNIVSIVFQGKDLEKLRTHAGQFFVWRFLDGRRGWTRGHPFSTSAQPTNEFMRITVKDLGDATHDLFQLQPGCRVLIEGPYGRLHAGARRHRKVALIGSGIGITPMRALLETLPQAPGDVTLIYRASHPDELVLRQEIERLAAATGATIFYVVGPRMRHRASWLPDTARDVSDAQGLRQLIPDIAERDVFICGSPLWMKAVQDAAESCGVEPENIYSEKFAW